MAAPEYVPVKPMDDVRAYSSPPRRPKPWMANRPGDHDARPPQGRGFGYPGPDQGYALLLAHDFVPKLHLTEGEQAEDAVEGAVGVALKRASLRGRAPSVDDLRVAFTIWGYLNEDAPGELVTIRRRLFSEAGNSLHYLDRRRIADAVPDETLLQPASELAEAHARDWQSLLRLDEVRPESA